MYTFAAPTASKMNYRKEHIIYMVMWILLYTSPVMGLYMRMSSDPHIDFSWTEILNAWKFNTVWLALFAIHNFLLTPLLLVKRRTWLYTALCAALLAVAMTALYIMRPAHNERMHHRQRMEMMQCSNGERTRQRDDERRHDDNGMRRRGRRNDRMGGLPLGIFGPGEMVAALGGLLLMGMNLGVKLYFKSQEDTKALVLIERQNLERQLEYLKYQVNPHFFMNTLNNIHALVDIDPERAKTTIVELSKMMRYILYEGDNRLVPLSREVQFLHNYVHLMRLRYSERVRIDFDTPDRMTDKALPPLLLIIFVENAFKHGISYLSDSFIHISIGTHDDRLLFRCRNSLPQQPADKKKAGGMGLKNARQRLDLLFQKDYRLETVSRTDEYYVELDIPLAPTPASTQALTKSKI